MSSIKLTADSGGGTFEIKAPSSSGNTRILTLPDTGNLTLGGPYGKLLQTPLFAIKTDLYNPYPDAPKKKCPTKKQMVNFLEKLKVDS